MSQLVRAYTQWAKTIGARHIRQDITSGVHTESTAKKLQHLGFQPFGVCLYKGYGGSSMCGWFGGNDNDYSPPPSPEEVYRNQIGQFTRNKEAL